MHRFSIREMRIKGLDDPNKACKPLVIAIGRRPRPLGVDR